MFRFGEPRLLIPLWLYVRSSRAEPSRLVRDFGQRFLLAIDGTTLAEETTELSTFTLYLSEKRLSGRRLKSSRIVPGGWHRDKYSFSRTGAPIQEDY